MDEYRDAHGFTSPLLKPDARALFETEPAGLKLQPFEDHDSLVRFIEQRLGSRVIYSSSGPTYLDKETLRPEVVQTMSAKTGMGDIGFTLPKQIAG